MGGERDIEPLRVTSSGERCIREITEIAITARLEVTSAEWVILSCAAAVEGHVSRIIMDLTEVRKKENGKLLAALLKEYRDDMMRTWDSRLKWLADGFDIAVAGDKEMQDYRCVVELRNALMHRGSELTPLQTRNFGHVLDLKRRMSKEIMVQFHGSRIVLTPETKDRVIAVSRIAVFHVDSKVLPLGLIK